MGKVWGILIGAIITGIIAAAVAGYFWHKMELEEETSGEEEST